jgi:CheY-like chemotaxis protein/HPt (histidine-containing phosphotransfer) domain-containing protein
MDHGSRFSVYLVLDRGDAEALRARREAVPSVSADSEVGASVLLAEDNPVNARVAVIALGKQGHRVTHVSSGEEALRALEAEPFDVVLMDLEMPGLDGLDTARMIRGGRVGGESRDVPIVAMTAHALSGYREKCVAAGMDGYISKPVNFGELNKIIQRLIARNRKDLQTPKGSEAPASHRGLMDWRAALARVGGDEDLLKELCGAFLEDLGAKISHITRAVAESDFGGMARLGHSLKGAAMVIAARSCTLLAEGLERAGKDHDPEGAERILRELAAERDKLKEIFSVAGRPAAG